MSREGLEALTRTRKWAHQRLIEKGSKVYQAFTEMEAATFSDGAQAFLNILAIGFTPPSPTEPNTADRAGTAPGSDL